MVTKDIKKLRESHGLNTDWSIWSDGCEGGESPTQIQERLDILVNDIKDYHRKAIADHGEETSDVLVVAHGHILRAFVLRWINRHIEENPSMILEAGGVGVLSYEHHSVEEPAICIGGAFIVPGED